MARRGRQQARNSEVLLECLVCGTGRGGVSNGRTRVFRYTCTSVADPVQHLGATSCPKVVDGKMTRTVGRYYYDYSAVPVHGRHWERTPAACVNQANPSGTIEGFATATPQQTLAEIKKDAKVTVAGPVSGPGWTGTKYTFGKQAAKYRLRVWGAVDVDQQGRARVVVVSIRLGDATQASVMTRSLTFSDFGAPVTVIPPPADQTFSSPC